MQIIIIIFIVGYRFIYHSEMKYNEEDDDTQKELFVHPKYKNIKNEVLNNDIYTIDKWEWDSLYDKAEYYLNTDYVQYNLQKMH